MSSSDIAGDILKIRRKRRIKNIVCITVWIVAVLFMCVGVFYSTDSSVLVGWTALVLVGWTVIYWRYSRSDRRGSCSTRYWPTATVAYNLIPYLDDFLGKRREQGAFDLVITGGDAHSMVAAGYPWKRFLEECLREERCSITWYVSQPDKKADALLQKLEEKYSKTFNYRCLADPNSIAEQKDKDLLLTLQSFHPTLAWNRQTGDKMMWIEGYHPPKSTDAFNCHYYGPDLLKKDDGGFEFYLEQINRAWEITERCRTSSA